jgi:GNAT superfamily N-acetyltransferase
MTDWSIERLSRSHDRSAFDCGKPPLDDFLRKLVSQYEKRNLGRTYVAVMPDAKRVVGYYTLALGSVTFENLPAEAANKLPRHPVPVALLARLAVDRSLQGGGLGVALLMDAFDRCLKLSDELAIHAVTVDAIDEETAAFYTKFGFVALRDDPRHLFLPMATIEQAFGRHRP